VAEHDAPTGQLYLLAPLETPAEALRAALEAGPIACVLLRHNDLDDAALKATIARLRPVAQDRGVAVLVEDRADLATALGCDGVHLSDPGDYGAARGLLGPEAIVGVACGASRHDAMVVGEKGADYVAFGRLDPEPALPEAELIAWWQMTMTVPCVALGARSVAECAELAAAGADFVGLGAWVWDHPDGPAAVVQATAAALATSGGTPDLKGD
jgi:thiamine-phosphate pyrophosphorylase